mgnify:CR=1 FL=1
MHFQSVWLYPPCRHRSGALGLVLGHPGDLRRMQPWLAALDLFDARGTALRYRRLSGWGPGREAQVSAPGCPSWRQAS